MKLYRSTSFILCIGLLVGTSPRILTSVFGSELWGEMLAFLALFALNLILVVTYFRCFEVKGLRMFALIICIFTWLVLALIQLVRLNLSEVSTAGYGTLIYSIFYLQVFILGFCRLNIPDRLFNLVGRLLLFSLAMQLFIAFFDLYLYTIFDSLDTQDRIRGTFRGTLNFAGFCLLILIYVTVFSKDRIFCFQNIIWLLLVAIAITLAKNRAVALAYGCYLTYLVLDLYSRVISLSLNLRHRFVIVFGFVTLVLLIVGNVFLTERGVADGDRLSRMLAVFEYVDFLPAGFGATSSGASRFYDVISFESFLLNQFYQFGLLFPVFLFGFLNSVFFQHGRRLGIAVLCGIIPFLTVSQILDSFLVAQVFVLLILVFSSKNKVSHDASS